MGLKEKLDSLFKKQPSPAELERMDKKKIDTDRARTEDLRARIDAASAFVTALGLPEEESAEIRKFYRQTSECMREIAPTSFDVSGIDRYVDGIVTVLERAMKDGGSRETIMRCFQGIVYGVLNGHSPISPNVSETDIIRRREDMTDRYLRIAQYSFEIDQMNKDVGRKRDQRRQRELEADDTKKKLQEMINEHPSAWYDLQEMTPTQRSEVTGVAKEMAGLMQKGTDQRKNIRQIDLLIGEREETIHAIEAQNSALFLQLQNWESEIDEQSLAEVLRLQKEFERDILNERKVINGLRDAYDKFDKAVEALMAGTDEKQRMISVYRDYDEMNRKLEEMEARDEAGKQRLAQDQAARLKEAREKANEEMNNSQTDSQEVYYN